LEGFSGGEVAEGGAGAFVEFFSDRGAVGLVGGDGLALGDVLADQAVGVLVGGRARSGSWGACTSASTVQFESEVKGRRHERRA
jgi:hypothetical protein